MPGSAQSLAPLTLDNVFRLGLPGEQFGPLVSQFFIRDIAYGTQTISQKERPYTKGKNYLTQYKSWLHAQETGNGDDSVAYPRSNETKEEYYEGVDKIRFISTMRDLARFVNKDALHQAYFNAALILLNSGAKWTQGNPYGDGGRLSMREAGFGTLGGPHILALVSEVATRALKVVWNQKWQVHLRLRPESYGGLVHLQTLGLKGKKRPYNLPCWVSETKAAEMILALNKASNGGKEPTLLLPMAFTAGSPVHPAYGAGHACVAGACVTVLRAFFKTFSCDASGNAIPIPLSCSAADCLKDDSLKIGCLCEKDAPYLPARPFQSYITGTDPSGKGRITPIPSTDMTIEGELNKLATNVAMGRSMGGVHWRTDNSRSIILGEALAAQMLADITVDLVEHPAFTFRTFSRKTDGNPKIVEIRQGRITVDGVLVDSSTSML